MSLDRTTGFNEAAANSPRKAIGSACSTSRSGSGFNEAAANSPRKAEPRGGRQAQRARFNEAAANSPRKE